MTFIAKTRQLGSSIILTVTSECHVKGIGPGDYVYYTLDPLPRDYIIPDHPTPPTYYDDAEPRYVDDGLTE